MKIDVQKLGSRYKRWKEEVLSAGAPGGSPENSAVINQHVVDMELGRNVARSSRKGGRSYAHLCNIQQRLTQVTKMLEARGATDLTKLTEEQVTQLFDDMQRGEIKTTRNGRYKSVGDYAKVFKAFWHWWMKVNRKRGTPVPDITEDISTDSSLPKFVYLTKANLEKLLPYFTRDEQVMLMFMFDSLIRAPTELMSLKAKDVYDKDGEVWVNVPDEVS